MKEERERRSFRFVLNKAKKSREKNQKMMQHLRKQTEENEEDSTVGPFVFSNCGAVSVRRFREAEESFTRGKERQMSLSIRYGTIVHVDDGNALRAFDVDEVGKEVQSLKGRKESEAILFSEDDEKKEKNENTKGVIVKGNVKIVSVKPRSEDVVACVVSSESDVDDDDVLEFYDVVGKGAVSRREEGTTKTKKVKQFVWEEKEDGMSYVVVTEGGSLIRNGTEEVAGGGVECAACHPKTNALAYANAEGSVFVGEDVVNLNDVKRIESIAFPNENSDDLVLVSALNGEDECRLLALRKKDGQWTASKLGGGFDIDPTQDAATGNPLHVVPINGWDVALCAHARAWDNQVLLVSTSASEPCRVLEIDDDRCFCTIPLAFDDENNFVSGVAVDYGASCGAMLNPSDGGAGDLPLGPTVILSTSDGRIACFRLACLTDPPGYRIEKTPREEPVKIQTLAAPQKKEDEEKVEAPAPVKNLWGADFMAKNKAHQAKVQEAIEEEEKPKSAFSFVPPAMGEKPAFSFGPPATGEKPAFSFGVPSTPAADSKKENEEKEKDNVPPPTPVPDPTPPRAAPPSRTTPTSAVPSSPSAPTSFEALADDPTKLLEQLSLGKISDVAAAREKLKQLFLKEHEIETTPKQKISATSSGEASAASPVPVMRSVDVTKIADDSKALAPMDPKASPLPSWGKKLEGVPKTSAASGVSASKDIANALKLIANDFENAKLECDAMLSDCNDACDAIQNENSAFAASAKISKKHFDISTQARDSARDEIQETKRVARLQNEAIGELWSRDRQNETMRCELESLIEAAQENLEKNQNQNPDDEDLTEIVDLDMELPTGLRKLKAQLRREMDVIAQGAADFEVRTNLAEREKKRLDRIKKAAGSSSSNSVLTMNQIRSQETTRALKAAIETQKEVIEDQNERLETTIADLREFGYDADVRVGKDGRVEVNAIETPGKQRLAALSSGVMFSTPGTASRGRGDDNLGVDVPTTSHKEAMDRAIKTLVKQPRVVVSEMKRDVLKQPLRRIEPRMPPKRIERTVSAPPVVSASAFAPVSAAKKVEVPPPPGAAKAPLFPAFSAPVAAAPSKPKEAPKKMEVPPPPSLTAPSLAPKKMMTEEEAASKKPLFPSLSASSAPAAPEAATASSTASSVTPAKPVSNLWSADFMAKNKADQAKIQEAIEEEEKPKPAFSFAPSSTSSGGDSKPAFSFGIAKNQPEKKKEEEKEEKKEESAEDTTTFPAPPVASAPVTLASLAPAPAVKPLGFGTSSIATSVPKSKAFGSVEELKLDDSKEGEKEEDIQSSPPPLQRAAASASSEKTVFSFGSLATAAPAKRKEEGETSALFSAPPETPKLAPPLVLAKEKEAAEAPVTDVASSFGSFGGLGSTTSTSAVGGIFGKSAVPTSTTTVAGAPTVAPAFGKPAASMAAVPGTGTFSSFGSMNPPASTGAVATSTGFGSSGGGGGAAALTGTPGFGQAATIGGGGSAAFGTPTSTSSFGQPSTSGGAAALTGTPSFGQAAKIGVGTPAFGSSTPQSTFGQVAAITVAAATAPSTPAPTSGFAAFANKPTGFGAAAAASGGGGFGALASQSGGGGGFAQAVQQASSSPFAQQASFGNQQQQQPQSSGSFGQTSGFGQPSAGFGQQQGTGFGQQQQSTGFGQQQGAGFGQQQNTGFGQASSGFGQASAFGQASGFGSQQQKAPGQTSSPAFTQMRR